MTHIYQLWRNHRKQLVVIYPISPLLPPSSSSSSSSLSWYWCISMYNACLQIIVLSIAATHREHRQTTKVVVIIIVIAIFSTVTIISIMMVVMMMMVMMIIWTRWWAGRVRSSLLGQMQFPSWCRRRYKLWLDYQMSPFPDFNFSHTWLWIPLNKYQQICR